MLWVKIKLKIKINCFNFDGRFFNSVLRYLGYEDQMQEIEKKNGCSFYLNNIHTKIK